MPVLHRLRRLWSRSGQRFALCEQPNSFEVLSCQQKLQGARDAGALSGSPET